MVEKKYYTIEEILAFLGGRGLTVGIIGSYTREKLIHPIIYLNSKSVHACEASSDSPAAIAVGHCFLSAHWDLGADIISVVDKLILSKPVAIKIRQLVKRKMLIGEPEIFSWEYQGNVFDTIPEDFKDLIRPRPRSEELDKKLEYFMLTPSAATLGLENLLLTKMDFDFLKNHFITQTIATELQAKELTKTSKTNQRSKAAQKSGRLSGKTRQEMAQEKKEKLKPALLKIAQSNEGRSANFIAGRAAAMKIIPDSQVRQTARYIEDDDVLKKYLKKNK